jgi:hypothetical protein
MNASSFWISWAAAAYPSQRVSVKDNTFHFLTLDEMGLPRIPYSHPSKGMMRKDGTFISWVDYRQRYTEVRKRVNTRHTIRLGILFLVGIGIALLV